MLFARDDYEIEEMICQKAILYPVADYSVEAPGVVAPLSLQIVEVSGFGQTDMLKVYLLEAREKMNLFRPQAEVVIKMAFPEITFEEMRSWTIHKLAEYATRAEWGLQVVQGREIELEIPKAEANESTPPEPNEQELLQQAISRAKEAGEDPMVVLGHSLLRKQPNIDLQVIGGARWRREGEFGWREQAERLSVRNNN